MTLRFFLKCISTIFFKSNLSPQRCYYSCIDFEMLFLTIIKTNKSFPLPNSTIWAILYWFCVDICYSHPFSLSSPFLFPQNTILTLVLHFKFLLTPCTFPSSYTPPSNVDSPFPLLEFLLHQPPLTFYTPLLLTFFLTFGIGVPFQESFVIYI